MFGDNEENNFDNNPLIRSIVHRYLDKYCLNSIDIFYLLDIKIARLPLLLSNNCAPCYNNKIKKYSHYSFQSKDTYNYVIQSRSARIDTIRSAALPSHKGGMVPVFILPCRI
jgi:hypothetical protein